ncbi:site-specific integrase [Alisedimentitalea sp. MJ-SS2]|uniref:tyrosine-type recombinase/integrase n=1 Tax=Aliisedimentitalea sp. MJ-SS2 TaxID=3049795 RepID=UPI00291112C3|nr:site-specific integrase [Alisedimentitalea sp. MJ-SS2]MDU8927666.1 site-specific integrase [Alisedimentitalea sp. MJ-SS2]
MASILEVKGAKGTRWRAMVRRKGYPPQSAYFDRKTDAQSWARSIEAKIDEGKHPIGSEARRHTVDELIDRYCLEVLPHKKSEKDQRQQLRVWKELVGGLKLSELSPNRILTARAEISSRPGRGVAKISNASVNRYFAALQHVLEIAVREYGWLEQNPMKRLKKLKEPQGRVRYLDADERKALLQACRESKNPYLEVILLIALTTGLRRSEILGMTWGRIELDTGLVVIEETKNGTRRSSHLIEPIIERLNVLKQASDGKSQYVFPGKNPLKPIDIKSAWHKAVRSAQLEDFRFHDLRHTAASYVAMDGGSVPEIAALLGHKSFQMAARYAHLSEGHTKSIIEKTMSKVVQDDGSD